VLRLLQRCALRRSHLTPLRSCPRRPLVRDPTPVRWQAMWRPPTQAAHLATPRHPRCPAALLGSSSGLPGVPGQPGTSEAWTALSQSGGFEKPLQPPPTLDRRAMPGPESGAGHLRRPLFPPGGRGQAASQRGPQHCCWPCQQGSPRGLPTGCAPVRAPARPPLHTQPGVPGVCARALTCDASLDGTSRVDRCSYAHDLRMRAQVLLPTYARSIGCRTALCGLRSPGSTRIAW